MRPFTFNRVLASVAPSNPLLLGQPLFQNFSPRTSRDRADISSLYPQLLSVVRDAFSQFCHLSALIDVRDRRPVNNSPRQCPVTSERGTLTDDSLSAFTVVRLECPVCFQIMLPPIFQCGHGHCVCAICHSLLRRCPICRNVLGRTRCLALEALSGDAPLSCRFEHLGCRVQVSVDDWMIHNSICSFAPGRQASAPSPPAPRSPSPRESSPQPSSPLSRHDRSGSHSSSSSDSVARSRYSTSLSSSHEI